MSVREIRLATLDLDREKRTIMRNCLLPFVVGIALLFSVGCEDEPQTKLDPVQLSASEIISTIQEYRQMKDQAFKQGADSPLRDSDKPAFQGLNYFPIDLKYRFSLPLVRHNNPQTFDIMTSAGDLRKTKKYGYFEFKLAGKTTRLQVYRLLDIQDEHPGYLFLPFMDQTTDHESYGGGRYLDFKENTSGIYEVDFNMAYNPSCAYGRPGFNCPIPPFENRLSTAIRAGEKKFLSNH